MWGLLLIIFSFPVFAADYYECAAPDGRKTYQMDKCPKSHQQTGIADSTPAASWRVDRAGEVMTTQVIKSGYHYIGIGVVNGARFKMMVDTGASFVSMSRDQAISSGIPIHGRSMMMQTANGTVKGILTRARTVTFAGHEVKNVDVVVQTEGKPFPDILLGMSYLKHFDINMSGAVMSLTRK